MKFIDLDAQRARLGGALHEKLMGVVESGAYILGPEVKAFEDQLSEYLGVEHVIGCASGTDALQIPLMAWGIGPGDAVFVPSFTFASTAEVVALVGATPVFVDINPISYNMDVASLEAAIEMVAKRNDLTAKAIIPVDLFGMPADYASICAVAKLHGLRVISDAAQSVGGKSGDKHLGSFGDVASTSFYPAKPLGCYGDGGAMMTNDGELAEVLRSVAFHGKGASQYDNVRIGMTSRLDTLQAAVLQLKLDILEDEMLARQKVAQRYHEGLSDIIQTAHNIGDARSAWAQYAIETSERDGLKAHLGEKGIPSVIYYVKPLHQQEAYKAFPVSPSGMSVTDAKPQTILCLPMHPYLSTDDQDQVIDQIRTFMATKIVPMAAE
ncbi:MAG: DegT/DnrJ/EryC1/StrS aminotransferase family protein [Pseudomonadota bacterium]